MEEWLAVSSMAADKPRPLLQNSLPSNDLPLLQLNTRTVEGLMLSHFK